MQVAAAIEHAGGRTLRLKQEAEEQWVQNILGRRAGGFVSGDKEGEDKEAQGNFVTDCTPGYYCIEGSSAPQPCRGGTHANQTVLNISGFLSSLDQCISCPAGTSCSVGSAEPRPCLPG